ncbi:MAG TPA: DUF6789 family protein [Gemmatimonadales bacterium]|nr:DUF6789 family protein [Gemmatimonadales bacterium]
MNVSRAVAAGVIGTATMTALLLIEPSIGLPTIAMGQILGGSLGLASALPGVGPALGWALHFALGALFALAFAALLDRRLPGTPVLRGLGFGLLLFLLAQVAFMPFVGGGFFSRGDVALLAGSLLGHLVYGAVMGWIYHGGVTTTA